MLTGDTNSSSYNLTHLYPLFATIKGQEDVYSSCCDFWNSLGVIPNSSLKQVVKYFRLKYPNVAATSVTLLSLSSNMCLACFILMFRIKSNGVRPVMAFNLRVKVERDIFMASARAVTSKSGSVGYLPRLLPLSPIEVCPVVQTQVQANSPYYPNKYAF